VTDKDIEYYKKINELSLEDWSKKCYSINDCSRCNMALHKDLFSTTKHTCIHGMSFDKYRIEIEKCEAYY
jgi:hypothetical protein